MYNKLKLNNAITGIYILCADFLSFACVVRSYVFFSLSICLSFCFLCVALAELVSQIVISIDCCCCFRIFFFILMYAEAMRIDIGSFYFTKTIDFLNVLHCLRLFFFSSILYIFSQTTCLSNYRVRRQAWKKPFVFLWIIFCMHFLHSTAILTRNQATVWKSCK